MECFIGTISLFGFPYAPVDWNTCQGQAILISQYTALYALLGVTYGGDGRVNFNLPNLGGRIPVGVGQTAPGASPYVAGQKGGNQSVTLQLNNLPTLPPHTHTATATVTAPAVTAQVSTNTTNNQSTPSTTNQYLSASGTGTGLATIWSSTMTSPVAMGGVQATAPSSTVTVQGASAYTGSQIPIPVMNPFLALNFCIAMNGLYPSHQ